MSTSQSESLFLFAIPLVPRRRARDWQRVLENLKATLQSILNQTDKRYMVLIATEDEIDLQEVTNNHVRLLKVPKLNFEPVNYHNSHNDATSKRRLLSQEALRLRAAYLMLADADDLISKNIVAYVNRNPHPIGYAITRGMVFDYLTGKMLPCPSEMIQVDGFDTYCGTSLIYTLADNVRLPDNWPISIVELGHDKVRRTLREAGTPLLEIEEPLIVYVLNSGENMTMDPHDNNPYRAFAKYVSQAIATHGAPFSRAQLDEFGLNVSFEQT